MEEDRKIEQLVFDRRALHVLNRLIKKQIVDYLEYPISTGKEAVVYRARSGDEYAAVKVYKIETSSFINRQEYLLGDPRFKLVKKTLSEIVYAFTKKEFKNLQIAERAGVKAPTPYYQEKNVLAMSFIGREGIPFPQMYRAEVEEEHFHEIVREVRKLYRAGLVHGDLSEFNILIGEGVWLVDFAQGVVLEHPMAEEFLERDIEHLISFFRKKVGLKTTLKEVLEEIRA